LEELGIDVDATDLSFASHDGGDLVVGGRPAHLAILDLGLLLLDLALHPRRLAHQLAHPAAHLHQGRDSAQNAGRPQDSLGAICYAVRGFMSYVVLARKWRPQSFADLVGQEHVATTLGNAIAQNRVAHAFLFTGVRGVGKTTSARILAKALNCQTGPTATPCGVCPPCTEIAAGTDLDVLEIDGASYNGVDEVRRLQESLPYRPSRDRFKIFIVDEVHMLSNAAWNAFLKTLEEPPPHVKFIFATTEVNKVPVTILSRCQRYDFKLIGAKAISARLREVLEAEGMQADDAALGLLAREAAGSMRDAMSLLDQVIAWAGAGQEPLTAESVSRVLGVAERAVLHRLATALVEGDAAGCLDVIDELAQGGYDLPHVAKDVLQLLRDLVVARVAADAGPDPDNPDLDRQLVEKGLLEMGDAEVGELRAIAQKTDADDLCRMHQGYSKGYDDIAKSPHPRAALEMALVRLARRPPLKGVDELLRRLGEMERRLGGGSRSSGGGGGGGGGRSGGRPTITSENEPAPSRPVAFSRAPPPPATDGAPTRPAPPHPAPPHFTPPEAGAALLSFRGLVEAIRARRPALASVLEHASVEELSPRRVALAFAHGSFVASQAMERASQDLIAEVVRQQLGPSAQIEMRVLEDAAAPVTTLAAVETAERRARVDEARRAAAEHPLVEAAIEVLGAELREVRLPAELADSVSSRA
jgi:DNA polymerase III subunit gamma/tau